VPRHNVYFDAGTDRRLTDFAASLGVGRGAAIRALLDLAEGIETARTRLRREKLTEIAGAAANLYEALSLPANRQLVLQIRAAVWALQATLPKPPASTK
jgi:hypothetical protein